MVINLFLFLALAFIFTFFVGRFIEKIRIPWVFAALILGALLAIYNPFASIMESPVFSFLSDVGMYILLFIIGLELDLGKVKKEEGFLFKSTFFIIFFEALFGSFLIHFVFHYDWLISILVALSFATVGEAILIPILDEFKIINTKLGRAIIGVGTLDDVIEILTLIVAVLLVGSKISSNVNFSYILISLFSVSVLVFIFFKLKKLSKKMNNLDLNILFLLTIFVLFLFLGVGMYGDLAPFAALLAGISIRKIISGGKFEKILITVKMVGYGLFVPIFFLSVGASMDMNYLISFPLLILLVVVVSNGAKMLGSYIVGKKRFGIKGSVLLGIGLSIRFSTSIIIIKMLFDAGVVHSDLYSIIVASSIVFKFLVPVLFSNLLVRWGFAKKRKA